MQWKWKLHSGLFIWYKDASNQFDVVPDFSVEFGLSIGAFSFFSNNTLFYILLPAWTLTRTSPSTPLPNLQGEYQKPRESGVLPPSHQVPPLQFEVSLVPSLHHHQPGIGGSFPCDVLIACKGGNHWPPVENQTYLRQMGDKIEKVSRGKK